MSYDYSENILVQNSAGNLLEQELGWEVKFAYNTEVLGENGTFGRKSYQEILLTKYLRNKLKEFNSWINEAQIKEVLDKICIPNYMVLEIVPMVVIVTSDIETLAEPLLSIKNSWDNSVLQMSWNYDFDIDGDADEEKAVYNKIDRGIPDIAIHEESGDYNYGLVSRATERSEFFGMYAGLLFMGILLSIVFLFATVLIIYYKQITEGYEDHKRFEIMQKIGMTTHDIRRSVNSQVLTVFFLPLLLAGLHLAFAFPILWKLLQMFGFSNMELMIGVTAVSYAVFAVVYVLVYKITSNVYYGIVSGGRK